jgi:hypothetical protein
MPTYYVGDSFFFCDCGETDNSLPIRNEVSPNFSRFENPTGPINIWPYSFPVMTTLATMPTDDSTTHEIGNLKLYPAMDDNQRYLTEDDFLSINFSRASPPPLVIALVLPSPAMDLGGSYLLLMGTVERISYIYHHFLYYIPGWDRAVFSPFFQRELRVRFGQVKIFNKDKIVLEVIAENPDTRKVGKLYGLYIVKCKMEHFTNPLTLNQFSRLLNEEGVI